MLEPSHKSQQLMLKAEGNYNSVNFGGKAGNGYGTRKLGDMTVNQILSAMKRDEYDAVGKYQIIPSTFQAGIQELGLSGNEKFSPQLQERFFNDFLNSWFFHNYCDTFTSDNFFNLFSSDCFIF